MLFFVRASYVFHFGLAELWAIHTALEVVGKKPCPKVVIESDSIEAIVALTSSDTLITPYLEMVGAIRRAMPPHVEVRFHHVLREANSVADSLEKSAHVFGFGTQLFPLVECRHLLYQDVMRL